MTGTNKDEKCSTYADEAGGEEKYIRMILVRVEAAKSINSAVIVKHKRKGNFSAGRYLPSREKFLFTDFLDKKFLKIGKR